MGQRFSPDGVSSLIILANEAALSARTGPDSMFAYAIAEQTFWILQLVSALAPSSTVVNAPSGQWIRIGSSSAAPSGLAGGDLSGTYPNPDIAAGVIVDADVNAAAAIDGTKISPNFGLQDVFTGGNFSTTGAVIIAASNPATSGQLRGANNFTINARNNANTANTRGLKVGANDSADTQDCVMIGDLTNVNRVYIDSNAGATIRLFPSVVGGLTLNAPGGFGSNCTLNNKALRMVMEECTFDNTRPYNTIFRRDNDANTPSFDQIFRGPGASSGSNQNGRHALVQGGRKTGTGLAGSVKLQRNPDDATFTTIFEVGDVGGASALGFFATAIAVKQTVTGAKGGNAALGSLLTALATYGLITDSSTA